jgi:hypothetical protein
MGIKLKFRDIPPQIDLNMIQTSGRDIRELKTAIESNTKAIEWRRCGFANATNN